MRLHRLKENLKTNEETRNVDKCINCGKEQFVWDYTQGDIICTNCGIVLSSSIFYDDHANNPHSFSSNCSDIPLETRSVKSVFGPIYVRYFHFNEVLATITLDGPWINNADYREIERTLKDRGVIEPTRGDIQSVCKSLNDKYGVQRFPKKYSEKWIQIVYRYCGKRPPHLHPTLIHKLRNDFKIMVSKWDEVQKLLLGSKKTHKRVQWPNYLETTYRLLKHRYRYILTELKPWITRLSSKKRKELKPFFLQLFKLVGF